MTDSGKREVLAVLFRHARTLLPGPTGTELRSAGVWQVPPQSIMKVKPEGAEWLMKQVDRKTP